MALLVNPIKKRDCHAKISIFFFLLTSLLSCKENSFNFIDGEGLTSTGASEEKLDFALTRFGMEEALGVGRNTSVKNNDFLDCVERRRLGFAPLFKIDFKIALGISPPPSKPISCGGCIGAIRCEAGSLVTIKTTGYDDDENPANYDSIESFENSGPIDIDTTTVTCDRQGLVRELSSLRDVGAIKVEVTSGNNTEIEYVKCLSVDM